ncbi:BET1-like protein [Panonychus citri]|uniref:BET1-like protein n=1 Tax=Panonychus citri TaxID=50023 RepID=UPI0023073C6D|nr:BET1-like protein [Panonychus citri]
MTSRDDEFLETDNRFRTDRLAEKVSQLKSFAVDIEQETKEHNRLLDDVNDDFVGLLGNVIGGKNKINRLLNSGRNNRRFLCYLSLGLTTFLIFSYYLIARSMSSY